MAACPLDVKESAYKGLVRPILEYGSSVWDPQSILLQDELEKVQKRAARFVTGNYVDYETGSMTGILKQLKWESLKKRRKDSRRIMLYKGLKGAASIPTNDLVPPIRRTRNHHSLAFQIPMAGQGPSALAVGTGGGCLDIFTLIYPFSSLSPSLWEMARYRLKYCLKGPLNPKPTNQPNGWD